MSSGVYQGFDYADLLTHDKDMDPVVRKPAAEYLRRVSTPLIHSECNMTQLYKNRYRDKMKPDSKNEPWTPYVGPVVWTGPDGTRHHRLKVDYDWQLIGIGENSPERTLSCTYLSRALPSDPFPSPRGSLIGEIGWFNDKLGHIKRTPPIINPR